ncbi:uncharacterized protein KY384_001194 [Bacidia gigantensis]|uniref:uncharacterized protein n=1 Tax=Bacidia gigantensis TaxID=2732470 RepID=UPI001D052F2A|nr:uncharacterized protein KY384_001194 [Bacidia gigantensis]KAG8534350.1 hypothetical protein KY384_001194 [Bacidia gigantensis]
MENIGPTLMYERILSNLKGYRSGHREEIHPNPRSTRNKHKAIKSCMKQSPRTKPEQPRRNSSYHPTGAPSSENDFKMLAVDRADPQQTREVTMSVLSKQTIFNSRDNMGIPTDFIKRTQSEFPKRGFFAVKKSHVVVNGRYARSKWNKELIRRWHAYYEGDLASFERCFKSHPKRVGCKQVKFNIQEDQTDPIKDSKAWRLAQWKAKTEEKERAKAEHTFDLCDVDFDYSKVAESTALKKHLASCLDKASDSYTPKTLESASVVPTPSLDGIPELPTFPCNNEDDDFWSAGTSRANTTMQFPSHISSPWLLLLLFSTCIAQTHAAPTPPLLIPRGSDTIDSYCHPSSSSPKWYPANTALLNKTDCLSALLSFKSLEPAQYGYRNLAFSDIHVPGAPGEKLPKRYPGASNQCVLYIFMRSRYFAEWEILHALPQGLEPVDETSYKQLVLEADNVYWDCVVEGGGGTVEHAGQEGLAGWKPAGKKHSIAVVFWGVGSTRDEYEKYVMKERLVLRPAPGSVE